MISLLEFYWRRYVNMSNPDREWAQGIKLCPLEEGCLNQDFGVHRVHATEIRLLWFAVLHIKGGIIPSASPPMIKKKNPLPGNCRLISLLLPVCVCCQTLLCSYGCFSSCLRQSFHLLNSSERDTEANRKQGSIR